MWQSKQLLRKLEGMSGSGTSLISLVVPAGSQISRV
jgi:peptide subunit release factor 1 (eRF1)